MKWTPKLAVIDFDVMLYMCGYAAQHTNHRVYEKGAAEYCASFKYKRDAVAHIKGMEDEYEIKAETEVAPFSHAAQNVKQLMLKIRDAIGAAAYKGYLTGKGNFRETLATIQGYKANRDPTLKPYHYRELKKYILENLGAMIVDGIEADDAIAIEHMRHYKPNQSYEEAKSVIATIDKDLNMIPGWHYNFQQGKCFHVNEHEGLLSFYSQLLTGDATDNISGIYKVGPVKAAKILAGLSDEMAMFGAVQAEYRKAFPDEDVSKRIKENGQLLWIWKKEDDLWVPPNER
jgi:5'-3' exonuclease